MELIREQIQFYDRILDRTTVYEESTDAIVPDSYPDIARIISATGIATIKDESPQNDRVLVSGTVKTTALYQPEGEEGLREISVPLSFAHIEEAKGLTGDSICFMCCRVINVEARAVNSRKLHITAKLCFDASAHESKELALTADIDGEELPLEIQYAKQSISLPENVIVRSFTVLEDLETAIGEDTKLLNTRCDLILTDCRAMHGKVVLKGDAQLHCLLMEGGGLRAADYTTPFTQILDCEGMEEGAAVSVRFSVHNLDSELHDGGVLSVGIGANALLCITGTHELCTIRDLYQTTRPLDVRTQTVHVTGLEARGELHGEAAEKIQVGFRVARVIDAYAVCHSVSQDDPSTLKLTVATNLLLQNDEGNIYSISRPLTLPVMLAQPMKGGTTQNMVLNVTGTPAGEDSVSVRIAVHADLYCRTEHGFEDVTHIEAGEPSTDMRDAVTLVLRFVNDEEPLWDIAKRYHTTVRAIRGANDLPAAEQVKSQMLLIPICEK